MVEWSLEIHDIQSIPIVQRQAAWNIYAIMKTMSSSSYHHNDFVATHGLEDMCGYTLLISMNKSVFNKLTKELDITNICDPRSTEWLNLTDTRKVYYISSHENTFSKLLIYYVHLASVRWKLPVQRKSLVTNFTVLLTKLVRKSLVHWNLQCVTIQHVPNFICCQKAIVVITGTTNFFLNSMSKNVAINFHNFTH